MHKKLAALFTIMIFAISTLAVANPVAATFTLGDLSGTYRYHGNDFDPHLQLGNGVVGYVWPGGGQNAYSGFPNVGSVNSAPGYQSPYPGGKPGAAPDTSGDAPSPSWYQLEGDTYAPFGAVLAGSTGDLIFAINSTCTSYLPGGSPIGTSSAFGAQPFQGNYPPPYPTGVAGCVGFPNEGWDALTIYLPPGFKVNGGASSVVTTISNDMSAVNVANAGPYDRYCPGCTGVYVYADGISTAANVNQAICGSLACSSNSMFYNHQFINFTNAGEWYYVRINGVTAPSVAGRYFFKIWLGGTEGSSTTSQYYLGGEEGVNPTPYSNGIQPSQFIPTENWPVMLVKGEVDPGIITGTIRYAGYNETLYNLPVGEAGKVYAKMTTRLDPYTGQSRPDLPLVDAQGYFNATAKGHYEVEGIAPGVYDLYASAMGYPQTLISSGVTVLRGQSLHFDGYLQPGPVIHGNVFTKHQTGDEPWPSSTGCSYNSANIATSTSCTNQYIKIELYDGPTLAHKPDSKANMVIWSPLPCVAGGQERYYFRRSAGWCDDPRQGGNIAAPWHEYVPQTGYFAGSYANPGYYQVSTGEACTNNTCTSFASGFGGAGYGPAQSSKMTQDPEGVGPPQHWFVQGGTTTPFHFEFGVKGEYGAPRDLDGGVPQVYATWVNGLTPGRYYARAWTFRYVQTALDGLTFQEYYFDITPNEWAGDVTLPIDIRLSSWINKTVHFHNIINGITEDPIDTGTGLMSGALLDASGNIWSYNQSLLGYRNGYSAGPQSGAGAYAFSKVCAANDVGNDYCTVNRRNDLDKGKLNRFAIETGRANIQFWGFNDTWGGEDYGIPSGTYQPHVFIGGYLENSPVEMVSVTLSGNPTSISDHVYRGAGFNVTIYSIDWEQPRVSRNWIWGNPTGYQYGNNVLTDNGGPPTTLGFPYHTNPGLTNGQQSEGCGMVGSWPNGLTQQPGLPRETQSGGSSQSGCLVGQEIDVGFYSNGTLISAAGDELYDNIVSGPTAIVTTCLFQNFTSTVVQMCGGGWDAQLRLPNGTYTGTCQSSAGVTGQCGIFPGIVGQNVLPYQGNTNDAFFGTDLGRVGYIGGYVTGAANVNTAKVGGLFQTQFQPGSWSAIPGTTDALYETFGHGFPALYGTALPGALYDLRGFTYGYIQDTNFQAYASPGQVADMQINLVMGVNVTLDILFKKEHIITATNANMSGRVRLFDESGNLVAEWMSSEGTYTTGSGFSQAADGTSQYPFANTPNIPAPKTLNAYNFVPGGTTLLHVVMAGLPTTAPGGTQNDLQDRDIPKGCYYGDPIIAETIGCDFGIVTYTNPGPNWNAPGFFPNYGIAGSSDYQGGWTAEVDFVNWYANNTVSTVWNTFTQPNAASSSGATLASNGAQYYGLGGSANPGPVPGLLMGESYHIIPGTTAKSGVSLTEDTALKPKPLGVGESLSFNHLGPYSQEGVWQIANAHNSGEASAINEVDLNGLVGGNVLAFTWSNEFRTLSWGLLQVTGAGLPSTGLNFYTYDGVYQAYLPSTGDASGSVTYSFSLTSPGYAPQVWKGAVSSGQSGTGDDLYLEQTNIPVPEFSTIALAAFTAVAAALYVLRRRRN
ncbi:MAG TPA: hypothetical protein VJZ75_04035 [Candidatus Bathyarchaeia archaeon]|nr:hypothetical protein [Candidatus Bathyarchaeia archaeon]